MPVILLGLACCGAGFMAGGLVATIDTNATTANRARELEQLRGQIALLSNAMVQMPSFDLASPPAADRRGAPDTQRAALGAAVPGAHLQASESSQARPTDAQPTAEQVAVALSQLQVLQVPVRQAPPAPVPRLALQPQPGAAAGTKIYTADAAKPGGAPVPIAPTASSVAASAASPNLTAAQAALPSPRVDPANRLEFVSAETANVVRLDKDAVVMRSGTVVRVGQKFETGEVLMSVDAVKRRIVTNERTLSLL